MSDIASEKLNFTLMALIDLKRPLRQLRPSFVLFYA